VEKTSTNNGLRGESEYEKESTLTCFGTGTPLRARKRGKTPVGGRITPSPLNLSSLGKLERPVSSYRKCHSSSPQKAVWTHQDDRNGLRHPKAREEILKVHVMAEFLLTEGGGKAVAGPSEEEGKKEVSTKKRKDPSLWHGKKRRSVPGRS